MKLFPILLKPENTFAHLIAFSFIVQTKMKVVLLVKNMVCDRCRLAVENILSKCNIPFTTVNIGEIQLVSPVTDNQTYLLSEHLRVIGLELIDDRTTSLIEKIKQLLIKKARHEVNPEEMKTKLSVYLSQNLHHEYTYLSHYF